MDRAAITKYLAAQWGGKEIKPMDEDEAIPNVLVFAIGDGIPPIIFEFYPFTSISHAFFVIDNLKKLGNVVIDKFEEEMAKGYETDTGWTAQYSDITPEQICLAAFKALAPAELQERLL